MTNLHEVNWDELPRPVDDGAARHLVGMTVPSMSLPGTDGSHIDLAALAGRSVLYAYPMTGRPDAPLPEGWDMLPGARGCTPQSCSFRDHADELRAAGVTQLFGLSTQDSDYQREAVSRLHLPFVLLSDHQRRFATAMRLPTFDVAGMTLLKRLTVIVDDARITKVFYPVFPPDQNPKDVLHWLRSA